MDAPVGVHEEEAGDAELLLTPHHTKRVAQALLPVRFWLRSPQCKLAVPRRQPFYRDASSKTRVKNRRPRRARRMDVSRLGRLRLPFAPPEGLSRGHVSRRLF